MKKIIFLFTVMLFALSLSAQPIINILTEFYSESLDEYRNVRIYLPGDYNTPPANMHYPVIYFLHGWTANHNSISTMLSTLQNLMDSGAIEPVIMVAADNWVEPFGGSVYVNSILWGDYEDYNVNDLVDWIDANYRTISAPEGRALIGHSMGGFGAFRYGLLHKDKFCAFAANAATINFDLFMNHIQTQIQIENSGPPYFYSFSNSGEFTQFAFLSAGAFSPNYNTPQTYIDPAIVEYPLDENGNLIDTVYQKIKLFDMLEPLHATTPQDSVGILFCCGTNDEWGLYPANAALSDTLDALGLPCEFISHTGGHTITAAFKQRALIFLDSLLVSPTIPCSCLPEGIIFSTQEEIDNFQTNYPGCTEIEGDVAIEGSDITSLAGLNVLTSIGGGLRIGAEPGDGYTWSDHTVLETLTGLDNLNYIGGSFYLIGNDSLTNLEALANLDSIGGNLCIGVVVFIYYEEYFIGNPVLTSLTGLEGLTEIEGSITIIGNNILTSLTGLEGLTEIEGSIDIQANYSLTSLAGLENLTSIGENLEIGGVYSENPVLTSLEGLGNLTSIGGELRIGYNDALTSLNGLENLTSIGGELRIGYNDALNSLTGLGSLTDVEGSITIFGNNALTSLTGLENVTSIGGELRIEGNDTLSSLLALDGITSVADLVIRSNSALLSLTGLNNLISIGGDLEIRFNDALASLEGLEGITSIGGYLEIENNDGLTSLAGLDGFTSIGGGLRIISNNALTCLIGLDNLTSIGGDLRIDNNNTLSSLTGLDNLTSIGGYLRIESNDSLTSLTGLDGMTFIGGYLSIDDNNALTSLMGLDNLTSIGGNLSIIGNETLSSLTGLEGLTFINGNLTIGYQNNYGVTFGNPSLTDITGLDNLTSIVGNCGISGNETLSSLVGLGNLVSIGGELNIVENNALSTLTGLESLASIGGDLSIVENNDLLTLAGLESLASIGGSFLITKNTAMNNLIGLENLTSIGEDMRIINNAALSSLTGLGNLTSIGGVLLIGGYHTGNPSLTSLTGLDNIAANSITSLAIRYNSSLSTCHVQSICDYLAAPNGTVIISNNAAGCNSRVEVEEACNGVAIEEYINRPQITISPNPFGNYAVIGFDLPYNAHVSILIYNTMGAKVAELHHGQLLAGQQRFTWHADHLPKGLYFCRVQVEEETRTQKIIKIN
jgi:enterochelin esterase-like enzyme